ncbi:MAG: DUF4142 domain-containing protein [Lysobacteraceae bacterium]|nr:MAG: DUF4142 domain-containing protein [Xanthomonadaceae bacterium]
MWKFVLIACTALGAAGAARAQDQAGQAGQAFASAATSAGMAAVALGEMADARSTNVRVQTLGRDIARDQAATNADIARIAGDRGFGLPDSVDAGADQREAELGALTGEDFDRRLLEALVIEHAAQLALYEREASLGADPDLRALARRTLPALRAHLASAKALQDAAR